MSEVSERWHDWRYDGRGYYLVNDPEITFQDDAEADAYCDEHNRALVGQAALEERAKIVAWLRKENGRCDCFAYEDNECACGGRDEYKIWPLEQTANYLERGEHLK